MENKNAQIKININEENVYAEYGFENKSLVEESLIDAVESVANTKPLRQAVTVNFYKTKDMNIDEKEFKTAYENTLKLKIGQKKHELARCIAFGITTMIIGIVLLILTIKVMSNLGDVVCELFDVFAWVFIWIGCESLTLEVIQIDIEIRKRKRLLRSEIKLLDK